jgi:hypothetical protein
MGDHYCVRCDRATYDCVCDLRERALDFFTGEACDNIYEALEGLKAGRRVNVEHGPLTKITHITSIDHLDSLIESWHLEDEFEIDDALEHAMSKDD